MNFVKLAMAKPNVSYKCVCRLILLGAHDLTDSQILAIYFHVNYTLTVNETAKLYSFILISCFLWECISYFHLIEGKYSHRLSKTKLHVLNFLLLNTYIIATKSTFSLFVHFKTFYFNIRMWYFIHVKIYYAVI